MSSYHQSENSEVSHITKWIALFLLSIILIVIIVMYDYDRTKNFVMPIQPVTLEGTVTPLTEKNMVTHFASDQAPDYKTINQIDPYNEIYIFSEKENEEIDDLVIYAKEKITCSGAVRMTGREISLEIRSWIGGASERMVRGETQFAIDAWECVK